MKHIEIYILCSVNCTLLMVLMYVIHVKIYFPPIVCGLIHRKVSDIKSSPSKFSIVGLNIRLNKSAMFLVQCEAVWAGLEASLQSILILETIEGSCEQ